MKKLIISVIFLFTSLNAYSQRYDFTSKSEISVDASIDINKAIQISNTDAIYDDIGVHYIGYGYWVAVDVRKWAFFQGRFGTVTNDIIGRHKFEGRIENKNHSTRKFYQNGTNYVKVKTTFLHVSDWDFKPIMTRSEYINVNRQNKELLEMGLMSQAKYDKELESIKYHINRY